MRRVQIGCVIAACLGLVACGDAAKSDPAVDNTAGQNTGGAGTGGAGSDLKPGDAVDLDGDGAKDDGVAVDDNGDGQVDGVDTDGDGKSDKPLPSGGGTGGTNANNGSTGNTNAGSTAGNGTDADASNGGGLACDGVGVCDDNFMDSCDADPDTCPATQTASIDEPEWDCEGEPPANVYAYAKFPDGTSVAGANLAPGACVAFFEGAKDLFYAKWFKFGPKTSNASCMAYEGCICPKGSLVNQSFDRRLYAFTWDGDESCAAISIIDHKENDADVTLNQPVSNECRKYLIALHTAGDNGFYAPTDGQGAYELPFSFVAGSLDALKLRLKQFPKVEVACVDVQTAGSLPWAQLIAGDVQTNPGFVAKK